MAMGTRQSEQASLWVAMAKLPKSPGHPFYARLSALLDANDFDRFVEGQCARFYAPVMGVAAVPSPIVNHLTPAIDRGDRRDVAMVVARHQCLLLRRDVVEVHNHEVNPIAELGVQPDKAFGLARGVPAVGGSKENNGRFARSDRTPWSKRKAWLAMYRWFILKD